MRRIYTFILYLLIPVILLRLFIKGRRLKSYHERISERFMQVAHPEKVDIWIHAVSLGEVVAATPLIKTLLAKPLKILVTTMTPTGSERVRVQFGKSVQHQYLPYDLPFILGVFFKEYAPKLGIILETELWPNLINQAQKADIPLILANARISDRAYKRYTLVKSFFKPVLKQFSQILAQSEIDASRFIALGAQKEQVLVCGNLKFDLQDELSEAKEYKTFKKKLGINKPVLIAASTHDNEEELILTHLAHLKSAIPDLVLMIAPRHPERFESVCMLCKQMGFVTAKRSEQETITENTEIFVLDSLGELRHFYQLADYAFVGGSLVPVGGHNILEPIALERPVLCGPYMQNIRSICADLSKAEAIYIASDVKDLIRAIIDLHLNKLKRQRQIKNASQFLKANQGSLNCYLDQIEKVMATSL